MKPANNAPVYVASLYPDLAEIFRKHGYALAVHGSVARDFDLIGIPWADEVSSHADVIAEITETLDLYPTKDGYPTKKNHGRLAYGFLASGCFLDLSFTSLPPLRDLPEDIR